MWNTESGVRTQPTKCAKWTWTFFSDRKEIYKSAFNFMFARKIHSFIFIIIRDGGWWWKKNTCSVYGNYACPEFWILILLIVWYVIWNRDHVLYVVQVFHAYFTSISVICMRLPLSLLPLPISFYFFTTTAK